MYFDRAREQSNAQINQSDRHLVILDLGLNFAREHLNVKKFKK